MAKPQLKEILIELWRMGILPITIYLFIFLLLTFPEVLLFSTNFFAGGGDGLHRIWDIWWMNKAVSELHQSPWYTTYIHYPYGTSLLGHTLTPIKGFMGIILLRFLNLIQTYNFLVIFSFVISGLTAFLLAHHFTQAYWPSLIAGGVFTFTNYHFAHLPGHLGLISLEWIPLFLLFWHGLLHRPRIITAIAAALGLFAVFLSNYYYFLYSVLAGGLIFLWQMRQSQRVFFFLRKDYLIALDTFLLTILVTVGPILGSMLLLNAQDPLVISTRVRGEFVGHDPTSFSMDLFALVIPGGRWRFAELTEPYWSVLTGFTWENSVYLGIPVIFFLVYVGWKRREVSVPGLGIWYLLFVFFTVMALGPVLIIWGQSVSSLVLPYALLERIVPPIRLSGVPVRMVIMSTLSASVISAVGFRTLLAGSRRTRFLAVTLLALLFIEYLPKPLPTTNIQVPEYISILRQLPTGGFLDQVSRAELDLYYQTIHEKPMAFGKVSRMPQSVREQDLILQQVIANQDYETLFCDYGIRYLAVEATGNIPIENQRIRLLYMDSEVVLYDLGAESKCDREG